MADTITWLFIILFVYAASSKLLDFQKFEIQAGKSPLLSPFSHWVAWLVPAIEIAISILLLSNKHQLTALYASFSLMVIFTGYIIVILNFSEYVPCSCGGILENMNWQQHLVFNSVFDVLGIIAVLLSPNDNKSLSVDRKGMPKTLNRVGVNFN